MGFRLGLRIVYLYLYSCTLSTSVCSYICRRTYTYVFVRMSKEPLIVHAYTFVHAHTCICTDVQGVSHWYPYVYVFVYAHASVQTQRVTHWCTYACPFVHVQALIQMYKECRIGTRTCMYLRTHAFVQMQRLIGARTHIRFCTHTRICTDAKTHWCTYVCPFARASIGTDVQGTTHCVSSESDERSFLLGQKYSDRFVDRWQSRRESDLLCRHHL